MFRKVTLLLSCLFFFCSFSIVAQNKADSLKSLLKGHKEDSTLAMVYHDLYIELRFEDPDQAIKYMEQSLQLSKKLNYQLGTLNALLGMGEYFETSSLYDSAINVYNKAQVVAKEMGSKAGIKESLLGLGSVFSSIQKLNEADSVTYLCIAMAEESPIDSGRLAVCYTILSTTAYFRSEYEKSIELDLKGLSYITNNPTQIARSFLNIGATYTDLQDYKNAEKYYLKGLEMAEESGYYRYSALAYYELGLLKTYTEDFEEARKFQELAMEHFETVNDKVMIAHVHSSLAKVLTELNEFDEAIRRLELALALSKEINSLYSQGDFLHQLGLTYYKKKDYPNAERYLQEAKSIFDELEDTTKKRAILSGLHKLYDAMEDYPRAYQYLSDIKVLDDSLFEANEKVKIAEIEEKYQNQQKEQEIELLSAENEIASLELQKQENLRNYLIVAAFLLVLLIGVVYNRYQLKARANAKLRELDTLKTGFFTNISHEFRTPLTLILSPLQRLLQKNNDVETKEALAIIHRNAAVLTELTNQLLDLSKLEAGKLNLTVAPQDFKAFIKVLIASFESLAVAQKVEFITEIEAAPEDAYFDEDKVQKILNNLLSNAFKFTSKEGSVTIRATHGEGRLTISVQDTGMGISQEDQKLIFKRFHQNSTNTPNAAGTGVGLTLSKELALLHKGDITVESEPGQGATFILQFPINKSAYLPEEIVEGEPQAHQPITEVASIQVDKEAAEPEAAEKIVLVVEDNPDLRNHMASLLKSDFTVRQSVDGKAGIEDALNLVPDIIITDLMMPEVDGVELCDTLKANEKTSHIPIIMLTAKADRDTKLDGLKTGADDFLTKPFDNEELLIRIQNLIAQREKLQTKYEQTLRLAPSKITVKSPEETFIKKALEVVDQHLSNPEFTVEAFQKEMGMSRMQLHRKLKALTKCSASEFIRDIRLQRAEDLLAGNGLNVTEVAYSCGFSSVSYFAQCFKQKFGVSPSSYETSLLENVDNNNEL
ncbi:MAG: tetratricopeptide repeat protein [Bacteroidota bacterium]